MTPREVELPEEVKTFRVKKPPLVNERKVEKIGDRKPRKKKSMDGGYSKLPEPEPQTPSWTGTLTYGGYSLGNNVVYSSSSYFSTTTSAPSSASLYSFNA